MFPRPFPAVCAVLLGFVLPARAVPPSKTAASPTSGPQPSIVYRSDMTDATAQGLSNQPQFSGCGIVYNGPKNELGTGAAIAANWVLTAKHVVTGYTTATFQAANGQTITGTVYTDSATDIALIKLDSNLINASGQAFTPVAFITPNLPGTPKVQPVGPLIWNVGYGNYGQYGGTVNNLDLKRRGGTNVVNSYGSSLLNFSNENTSGTEFECSTGPGDSGGPMYLQTGYQWRIAAEVYGVTSNGFSDTDVSFNSYISTTTGINFAPQAAPTSLTWNSVYLSPSSAASKNITNFTDGGGNWNTTRLNFVGATASGDTYTYAWQNGTLLPVTFGRGTGAAGTVTVTTPINISDVTFAVTGGGSYGISGIPANPLTLAAAGSSVTVNNGVAGTISAVLAGNGALTKLGPGQLTLAGGNTYTGGTSINAGTVALVNTTSPFGPSGNISLASGATLTTTGLGSSGLTVASGRTLTDNGTIIGTLTVGGTLTGAGTVGTGSDNYTLTINAGGLVQGASGTLTLRNAITNNGTIRMPAGAFLDASTTPSFTNNGVLDLTGGNAKLPPNFTNGNGGLVTNAGGTLTFSNGGIINYGTIRMTGGAVFDASAATYFYNYGTLDLLDGSAKLPPGPSNMGGTVLTNDLVRVKSTVRTGTSVTLTIDSYSGHNYQLQRGTSPGAGSFTSLGNVQTGSTGTTLTFTDSTPPANQGFYRVVLTP